MSTSRSVSYSIEEDKQLCHVWLDVSQNPIIGINQSSDKFWSRVRVEYEKSEISRTQPRPTRSLQTRMTKILAAVSKLRGCVNQVEKRNPSGASDQDILNQAKMLLTQYVNYKGGFKYDHVWPILKGIEKFSNSHTPRAAAFEEDSHTPNVEFTPSFQDESSPSPGMNSFDLNMNSEETTTNLSQRPMGVKQAKKKQQDDANFKRMMEQSENLAKAIAKDSSEKNEIRRQKLELRRMKQEQKILFTNLSSITDPAVRAYIENQKAEILSRGPPTNRYGEHGESSRSQYRESQHRASQYQGDPTQGDQVQGQHVQGHHAQGQQPEGEVQRSPIDSQNFTSYYNLLNGNNFPGY